MLVFGYAKGTYYTGDGTLMVRVRIPSAHGPYSQRDYNGAKVRNYVKDEDLPTYPALLMSNTPIEGDVVALASINESSTEFVVIGMTGGHYQSNSTNLLISDLNPY